MKKADCQSYNWPLQKKLSHELRQPCHPASHGSWQEPLAAKSWQIWKKHSLQPQCIVWISSVNLPRTHSSPYCSGLLFSKLYCLHPHLIPCQKKGCSKDEPPRQGHVAKIYKECDVIREHCKDGVLLDRWNVGGLLGFPWEEAGIGRRGFVGHGHCIGRRLWGKSNDNVEVSIPGTETFFHFQSSRFTNSLMKYGYLKVLIFGKHSIKKDAKNRCEWTSWTEWSLCLA